MESKVHKKTESAPVKTNTKPAPKDGNTAQEKNAGIQMEEAKDPKIKMEAGSKGINMGDIAAPKDVEELKKTSKTKDHPSVTFSKINYESGKKPYSKTPADRIPLNKNVPFTVSASGIDKDTTLHIVPEGSDKASKKDILPATLNNDIVKDGTQNYSITGLHKSKAEMKWQIIAVRGHRKVIGRSNSFVISNYPYRVFREAPIRKPGELGYLYKLVFSCDSYDDPTSYKEALSKKSESISDLTGIQIKEDIAISQTTGLFSSTDPVSARGGKAFLEITPVVQTNPADITDESNDDNSLNVNVGPITTRIGQAMKAVYDNSFGRTEHKVVQTQHVYFSDTTSGISIDDQVEIPESVYTITHKLIFVPNKNELFDKHTYVLEVSSNEGEGYADQPISDTVFF